MADKTKNGSESGTSFRQALYFNEIGFNIHDTMIYKKLNYVPLTHNRYEQEFEYMFCFSKGKPKTFNPIKIPCKYAGQETWGNSSFYKTDSDELTNVGKKKINDEKIKAHFDEVLNDALNNNVKKMFVVGWDKESSIEAIKIAEQYDFCYGKQLL